MADFDSIKVVARQEIIDIPEHIEYPSLRIGLDNIEKNDKICITIQILDGNEKIKFDVSHKLVMKEFPTDNKVVGRGVLNLIEVPKEPVVDQIKG